MSLVGTKDLQRFYLCSYLSFSDPREMLPNVSMTAAPIHVIGRHEGSPAVQLNGGITGKIFNLFGKNHPFPEPLEMLLFVQHDAPKFCHWYPQKVRERHLLPSFGKIDLSYVEVTR
jgi:hypothetical protein